MKKVLAIALAASMLISLAACRPKTVPTDGPAPTEVDEDVDTTVTEGDTGNDDETEEVIDTSANGPVEAAMIPGTLYYLNVDESQEPVIKGVWLSGNQHGTPEFNTGNPTTEGIRDIFALNEWVDIYMDSSMAEGIQVFVFKHSDDLNKYENYNYLEEIAGIVSVTELYKPEEADGCWGSFYLNPEDVGPGYYDLVFVCLGKATVVMETRFYKEGELDGKSDEELHNIMNAI